MAAGDAQLIAIKNTALRITFPIFDADGDLVTGAAGLDSEVSKDAAAFGDCTNEATEITAASGMYYLDLTAAEMNADTVAVITKTSTSGAKTTPIVIYPVASLEVDLTAIGGATQSATDLKDFADAGYDPGTNKVQGVVLVDTTTTNTDMVGTNGASTHSAADASDAVWNETSAGHTDAGKAGQQLWTDIDAILVDSGELQTNQGNWVTATGFSTHSAANVATVILVTPAQKIVTDANGYVTSSSVEGNLTGTINGLTITATSHLFSVNSGTNYAAAHANSVVKQIADNAASGGGDATAANQNDIITHLTDVKGTGFAKNTHSLTDILADSNELQAEWADGGRLDLLLDDVPTTAEFDARTIVAANYFDPAADTVNVRAITAAGLAMLFTVDTTQSGGSAVNGSVVKEIYLLQAGEAGDTTTDTFTISAGGSPVPAAFVWVTDSEAGGTLIASGTANASGVIEFTIAEDTGYWLWVYRDGVNFPDYPKQFDVGADSFSWA